jgi:hypothetical protein
MADFVPGALDLPVLVRIAGAAAPHATPAALARRTITVGAWRSLAAHLAGGQGVGGSNPLAPTSTKPSLFVAAMDPFQ